MQKTIIAKVKTTDSIRTAVFIAIFVILCGLTVPRYVIEAKSSGKFLVAATALVLVIAGIWMIVKIIQRTYIYGVISLDAKNLYIGRRRIAWQKIAQIFTIQRLKETYLIVTLDFIPVDKILTFEEDDATGPSDALAYRLSLTNFNLSPGEIEQILNRELKKHQKYAGKKKITAE